MWHYLICAFGGGGFEGGADWAPGQRKGADSARGTLRSRSSSCLPDWRAVDQPESSSLNTKPDSDELPGAHRTQTLPLAGICFVTLNIVCQWRKFRGNYYYFFFFLLMWFAHRNKPLVSSSNQTASPVTVEGLWHTEIKTVWICVKVCACQHTSLTKSELVFCCLDLIGSLLLNHSCGLLRIIE